MTDILVIIPAHNEEKYLPGTLDSLLKQSLAIKTIVVVDDASTDNTQNILSEYTAKHPNIKLVSITKKEKRLPGGKVVRVFNKGLATVDLSQFDYVAKIDSDLIFPTDYFKSCIQEFQKNASLGLVGGVCVIESKGIWIKESVSKSDHIRGALKLYRKEAFIQMQGLDEIMGWDSLDEYKLQFHNWNIKVLEDQQVKHLRLTNRATKWKKIEALNGRMFYDQRFGLVIGTISCLKRGLKHAPKIRSGLYALYKFYGAYFGNKPPYVNKELGRFIRKYRYARMLKN